MTTKRVIVSAEQEAKLRELHAQGLNDRQIGELIRVSGAWVGYARSQLGLPSCGKLGRPPGRRGSYGKSAKAKTPRADEAIPRVCSNLNCRKPFLAETKFLRLCPKCRSA